MSMSSNSNLDPLSESSRALLERIRRGDREALIAYIADQREAMRIMARVRLHPALRARFDVSDVIQEAMIDAMGNMDAYLRDPKLPPRLWLRRLVGNRLFNLHRDHLDAQKRSAHREVSLGRAETPSSQADALAEELSARITPPLQAAIRLERRSKLKEAIEALEPMDQEVLALRHFEQLSPKETAAILDITEKAASKRYLRALKRLREALQKVPGGEDASEF